MADDFLSVLQEGVYEYYNTVPLLRRYQKRGLTEGHVTTRAGKQPDVHAEVDFPLLILEPTTLSGNANLGSGMTGLDVSLRIAIFTGDKRYNKDLAPMFAAYWAATQAAIHAGSIINLEWREYKFVKNIQVDQFNLGPIGGTSENAAIMGYSAVGSMLFNLNLPKSLLDEWLAA